MSRDPDLANLAFIKVNISIIYMMLLMLLMMTVIGG